MQSRQEQKADRKSKQQGYVALRGGPETRDSSPASTLARAFSGGGVLNRAGSGGGIQKSGRRPGPDGRQQPRASVPTPQMAPGQPAPAARSKGKFVELPSAEDGEAADSAVTIPRTIFEDLPAASSSGSRGRITIYCVAETLNRDLLSKKLRERGPQFLLQSYPDVLYGRYSRLGAEPCGDIFFFDYGCIAFWGLTEIQEQDVLRNMVVPCEENPLPVDEVEIDEFQFHYTASEKPHIQNDTITINHSFANDHLIKLSISHALSQSTKLCVFEERVIEIVSSTKDLPGTLAATGKVPLTRKAIAQLIGKVFIQKSAVNLLSTVLDTPEFFWSAPDSMQTLYKRVCQYMELEDRVEVLNNRLMVLQEMLDMLRDHSNNAHSARLEWIVIWLIVVEVIVGLFETASILGWVGTQD